MKRDPNVVAISLNLLQAKMLEPSKGELRDVGCGAQTVRLQGTRAQMKEAYHAFSHSKLRLQTIAEYQRWNAIDDKFRAALKGADTQTKGGRGELPRE